MTQNVTNCRNPKCGEPVAFWLRPKPLLCPSCRYISQRALFLGSLIGGALAWWLR